MKIISNTSPLIALAKINRLYLLPEIFSEITIPKIVEKELLAKMGEEGELLETALQSYIQVVKNPTIDKELMTKISHLDKGEQNAITLALLENKNLLIDEKLGRKVALDMEVNVLGFFTVLLQAKNLKILSSVRNDLDLLRNKNYWIANSLYAQMLELADESNP
ncbi:MAG TPA: DUF3368 domain-containing protein [Leptospiraceae bacterium]|nr:DUF3368 domain-containing protein [Leptospiraceae bacterium]HRG74310.1 DUF3368 domain-containing protein [Leptospiraceae bacterium]